MAKFFISFNSADRDDVRYLVGKMEKALPPRVGIFYDEQIAPSEQWWEVILTNITNADAMLCVLTRDFFESRYCRAEYIEAVRLNMPIVPLLFRRNTVLPFEFRATQHIDMIGWVASGNELPAELTRILIDYLLNPPTKRMGGTSTPHPDLVTPSDWRWETIIQRGWAPPPNLQRGGKIEPTESQPSAVLLAEPFAWCAIDGGEVVLQHNTYGDVDDYIPPNGQSFVVTPFAISKYPITNAQFAQFVAATDGYRVDEWWAYADDARQWHADNPYPDQTAFAGDALPRTNVNWYEAMAFCRWLSARTGEAITLPTEQQWQWAAQGPAGYRYPWGDAEPTPERANYAMAQGQPSPVGYFPHGASPFGVQDMAGNVWEWCYTSWHYGNRPQSPYGPRVVRGGAWSTHHDTYLLTTDRSREFADTTYLNIGFRIVRNEG